jgi:hypothetical protein
MVTVFNTSKLARSRREVGMPGEQAKATAAALFEVEAGLM